MFVSGPIEVGISRTQRRTLEHVVEPLRTAANSPFQPGDLLVLSGGARGVTAEVAVALARAFRPTLVLLGRTPAPEPEPAWLVALTSESDIKRELGSRANGDASVKRIGEQYRLVSAQREIRQTLARIEEAGARALYRAVDIRDANAVAAVLTSLCHELDAPVRGLVHGAGVLADARIEDKTPEQFERVYGTKVAGLRSLLRAVEPDELRALVLFSSSTGRFGRTGQVDYAIANEVLNKLARQQARRLPRCRVVAVNWGPWDGGMVTPALKKVFEQEGIGLIPLEAGADYLVEELRSPPGDAVEVVVLAVGSTRRSGEPSGTGVRLGSPDLPSSLPNAFERVLDRATHPVLESHVLDGRPVLPTVLILEWLAHGALHQNPGLVFHGCDDLRILHGVILDGDTAPILRVGAGKAVKREGFFVAPVELRGVRRMAAKCCTPAPRSCWRPSCPPRRPLHLPHLVGLTHACRRRSTRSFSSTVPTCTDLSTSRAAANVASSLGCAALRRRPSGSHRPLRQRWLADPLVLDCSFQMMVVWSQERHGAPSLPCHIARYRQYQRSFPASRRPRRRARDARQRPARPGRHRLPRRAGPARRPAGRIRVRHRSGPAPGLRPPSSHLRHRILNGAIAHGRRVPKNAVVLAAWGGRPDRHRGDGRTVPLGREPRAPVGSTSSPARMRPGKCRPAAGCSTRATLTTPPSRAPTASTRCAAVSSTKFRCDVSEFDLPADLLAQLDPVFHLALHAGRQAFASGVTRRLDRRRVGVILGNIALPTERVSALARAYLGRTFAEKIADPGGAGRRALAAESSRPRPRRRDAGPRPRSGRRQLHARRGLCLVAVRLEAGRGRTAGRPCRRHAGRRRVAPRLPVHADGLLAAPRPVAERPL